MQCIARSQRDGTSAPRYKQAGHLPFVVQLRDLAIALWKPLAAAPFRPCPACSKQAAMPPSRVQGSRQIRRRVTRIDDQTAVRERSGRGNVAAKHLCSRGSLYDKSPRRASRGAHGDSKQTGRAPLRWFAGAVGVRHFHLPFACSGRSRHRFRQDRVPRQMEVPHPYSARQQAGQRPGQAGRQLRQYLFHGLM